MDKLLGLNMVPPTVEKKVKGTTGAAVMWCTNTKSFKDHGGVPTAPARALSPRGTASSPRPRCSTT